MKCTESVMTSLERRVMLAVDFNVDDRVMKIDGDSNRNRISIYVDDDRTLVLIDNHRERNIDTDDFRSIDINGADGSDRIQVFGSNASISIKIVAGTGDDRIQVESSSNSSRALISGGAGEDSIRSGAAFNEMFGGDRNDSLYATRGRATIAGGNGDDKLSAQGADKVSTTRMLRGNAGRDTLIGSDFNDHLMGDGGRDRLYGNDGDDSIEGGDGIDTIFGGFGNDTIFGQAWGDSIYGGDGSDFFSLEERSGGEIHDFLYGNDFAY